MGRKLRIIIVEDVVRDAILLAAQIEQSGYELTWHHVETKSELKDALNAAQWDAIICDYSLPHFDALSALATLKESGLDLPFIVVSGVVGEDVAVQAMKAGAHDFVLKGNLARLIPSLERELMDADSRRARKLAEHKLKVSEEKLRVALDGAQLGMWDWNIETDEFTCSEHCKTLLALNREALITYDVFLQAVHVDDRGRVNQAVRDALERKHDYSVELRVPWPSGAMRWIAVKGRPYHDAGGAPIRMTGIVMDITASRSSEEILRQSEERFRTLADNMSQFAWMADENGWIFWYNKRWFEFTGTTLEEMQGWGWKSVHHPEHVDRVVEKVAHCFKTGEFWEDTFPLRGRDGQYRWFLSSAVPIHDERGKVIRWFGTNTDISDLLTARAEAERANRAKDEFLSVLSHELRTPLTAMLGWVQMLRSGKLDSSRMNEGLRVIERNVFVQKRLIEDLLDVSKAISGKLELDIEPINLGAVAAATVQAFQNEAASKGIKMLTCISDSGAIVRGDSSRLQQVLMNLLANSIKFTEHGGQIAISVVHLEGRFVTVEVSDTGVGIDPDFIPHVFDRFAQADSSIARKFKGLGLGLSIVRHITELHGGTVKAESEGKGKGARFVINIPVAALTSALSTSASDDPRHKAAHGGISAKAILSGIHVLLVEDEPDSRELLRLVLESHGASVDAAASVPEAFEKLFARKPQLVLSDIGLPGEDGYAFIRKVRSLRSDEGGNLPAVALTAYARWEDKEKALNAGFQEHLAKPVEPEALVTLVAKMAANRSAA